MEFWANFSDVRHKCAICCEMVKSGEPLKVMPGDGIILHLSQACLGELKKQKGNESVCLFINVDGKKLVLGTLSTEKLPQQQFDLVFDRDFELSHNWKSGSVYFYGYKAHNAFESGGSGSEEEIPLTVGNVSSTDESESEEEIPVTFENNGKPDSKPKQEEPVQAEKSNAAKSKESGSGKQKVKIVEPNKDVNSEEDDESSDEDMMSDDDEDDSEDDIDEDDDESDESDEETPKKVVPSKKRPAESASKTPAASDKKAKVTPQKIDDKKACDHVATPYPSKQAGKTPATKSNQQTPKSGGSHTCKSCNKGFCSDKALESHSKAKHAAK